MRTPLAVLLLLVVLLTAGCGSKSVTDTLPNGQVVTRTVPNVHFAKTKFLLHAGLAIGAFHRYILGPLHTGAFRPGAPGRKAALAKAAAAALFAYHELKQAHEDALSSNILRRDVLERLEAVTAQFHSVASSVGSGGFHSLSALGVSSEVSGLLAASRGAGATIKDLSGPIPGI